MARQLGLNTIVDKPAALFDWVKAVQLQLQPRFWKRKNKFKEYQQKVLDNCKALANGFTKYGVDLVSGGSDNHLLLLDLRSLHITGKELEHRLDEVYITANKNAIPNDPEKPFVTSGIRVGTPAVTTRGLDEADMEKIAEYIYLCATDFEGKADFIREGVNDICARYPLYR